MRKIRRDFAASIGIVPMAGMFSNAELALGGRGGNLEIATILTKPAVWH